MEFLTAVISTLVATGVCAVLNESAPLIAEQIVRLAAARLHPDISQSCEEEWLADIDRRHTSIAKVRSAITLYFGSLSLPQYDPREAPSRAEESVSIADGTIRIVLRFGRETHEYELEGDPAEAAQMLRRAGHDRAADLLDVAAEGEAERRLVELEEGYKADAEE